jgi:hypothetical protein
MDVVLRNGEGYKKEVKHWRDIRNRFVGYVGGRISNSFSKESGAIPKSVRSTGGTMHRGSMVRAEKSSPLMEPSYGRNRKSKGCMAFWKTSSAISSRRRIDKKASPGKFSSPFWNGDWTTRSTGWVLLIREMKHASL